MGTEPTEVVEGGILDDIKSLLNVAPEDTSFDKQLILDINSVFMILHQMGVGSPNCYHISSKDNKWEEFLTSKDDLESVKQYIAIKVRLIFDPPNSGTANSAMNEMIKELEYRLYSRENYERSES